MVDSYVYNVLSFIAGALLMLVLVRLGWNVEVASGKKRVLETVKKESSSKDVVEMPRQYNEYHEYSTLCTFPSSIALDELQRAVAFYENQLKRRDTVRNRLSKVLNLESTLMAIPFIKEALSKLLARDLQTCEKTIEHAKNSLLEIQSRLQEILTTQAFSSSSSASCYASHSGVNTDDDSWETCQWLNVLIAQAFHELRSNSSERLVNLLSDYFSIHYRHCNRKYL